MHRILTSLLVVAFAAIVACGPSGTSTPASSSSSAPKADVKLGAYVPLTGAASFVGQGWQLGSQMAMNEINANGGIDGRKLSIVFIDDAGTPTGAITAVRRLIDEEKVFAVLAGSTSTATVAVVPTMVNGPTPYYVGLGSDPRILNPYSDYVFSGAGVPSATVVEVMSKYITTSLKPKTLAFMQCDQAFCQSTVPPLKAALESAGVQVTVQTYTSGATDFTGQIDAIKKTNPDVVVNFGLAADGGRIIPQLRRAGITATIVGDTSQADPSVLSVAGNASEGFVSFWIGGSQFLDDNTGVMADWRARFAKAFPTAPSGTPNLYSLMAYADTYVVAEAIRRAGGNLTQQEFINQLNTINSFIAGKDAYFKYAAPIGLPRSFAKGQHQGTTSVTAIVAKNGVFQTAK